MEAKVAEFVGMISKLNCGMIDYCCCVRFDADKV